VGEAAGYLEFEDRSAWRGWLEAFHDQETEAWVVHVKAGYRSEGLGLDEAVEEALCFGWIDSTLRRLDEKRYVLRYSPRRADSVWSVRNIERVERLTEQGRMTDAGLKAVAAGKESGQWAAALRREEVDVVPAELEAALRRRKGALAAYRALPGSRKKRYIYWLQSAKRPETAARRVARIVEEVSGS
jgi:uncharacterized protein YdeI (YjbR/CyaY-like superfamily)